MESNDNNLDSVSAKSATCSGITTPDRTSFSSLSVNKKSSIKSDDASSLPKVLCTPCLRNDLRTEAVKYCVDCAENFCKPCLRKHIKAFANAGHKLVGKNEIPEYSNILSDHSSGLEKCPRHADLNLDNFCEQHQVLCCDKCAYLEHGACKHIVDLITATRDVDLEAETIGMQECLSNLISELRSLKGKRHEQMIKTRQNTVESLSVIRKFRKRVNEIFDGLEKEPTEFINNVCLEQEDEVNVDVKRITCLLDQLGECSKKIRGNKYSDIIRFAFLQQVKTVVKKANVIESDIIQRNCRQLDVFVVNKKVEDTLKSFKSIGTFMDSTSKVIELNFQEYFDVADHSKQLQHENHSDHEIMGQSKENIGDIHGITTLSDGRFVLADSESKELRLFSNDFIFERKLLLGKDFENVSEPFAVCRIGDQQIAVTLPRDKVVDIVDFQDDETGTFVRTEIEVGEYCRGLAYSYLHDELYVACGGGSYKEEGLGHIRVFNVQGNHLRSLTKATSTGSRLLNRPVHIAVSEDGTRLYITDHDKGMVTTDRNGKYVTYLSSPALSGPCGVCVDTTGRVLVTCNWKHSLVQVSEDGQTCSIVQTGSEILCLPNTVCFDKRKSRLIVSTGSNNKLAVFSVN